MPGSRWVRSPQMCSRTRESAARPSDSPAARVPAYFLPASFYASPAAGYVNGINLPVDGGRTKSL